MSAPLRGEDIVKGLFGGTLADQGRGYYVALELLALLRGAYEVDRVILPTAEAIPTIRIHRRSHDFVRRLMAEPCRLGASELDALGSNGTVETLRALSEGLRVPIPGRRRRPDWLGEHLYPYVGELVHYDAAPRRRRARDPEELEFRVSVERYTYRGAGGLAHKILRTDTDTTRLTRTRTALEELVGDSDTPLGRLFTALAKRDLGVESEPFKDSLEAEAVVVDSPWVELLRQGVSNIAHRRLPQAKRIDALMHWVPYCIARHQIDIACAALGEPTLRIPVDFGIRGNPIRRYSREALKSATAAVIRALEARAEHEAPHLVRSGASARWRTTCRGFMTGTLGAIGALNAMSGQRHFVMRYGLLEATVLAMLREGEEATFDAFCRQILFDRLSLVVDQVAAAETESLQRVDRSDFESNAQQLRSALRGLGMLHEYSDMTMMVRGEVE